jgi:RNA polymerase sigma-70 factor (ECF subfamily)
MMNSSDPGPRHAQASGVPKEKDSDGSLLRKFRSGSQDAATLLYKRYAKRLYALVKAQTPSQLARRVEPDDLVQSVFCTFFQKASDGFYDVPVGEHLWKLLLVIALNKIRNQGAFHFAAKRDVRLTTTAEEESSHSRPQPDDVATTFLKLVIEETLEPMPAVSKAIVELRIEGYEVAEIAAKTGRSQRTVERNLQDFRTKLDGILWDKPGGAHGQRD